MHKESTNVSLVKGALPILGGREACFDNLGIILVGKARGRLLLFITIIFFFLGGWLTILSLHIIVLFIFIII